MKNYQPKLPFNVPFKIQSLIRVFVNGVNSQEYQELDSVFYCSVKSYGGTEKTINGVYVIEDTIIVDTWYTPSLKSKDRIRLLETGEVYEILNTPEDIDRRHKWMKFKAVRIHG